MNTASPNPFSGLKGALAGLVSGGWMGLVLRLLFWRRIAPMLTALEGLFAQWKAGTLPVPAAPVRSTRPAAARPQMAAPRARRSPRAPASRRPPVARAAAPRAQHAAWQGPDMPRLPKPAELALPPLPDRTRCTGKPGNGSLPARPYCSVIVI
jgi:hypothetical protein